jgi:hypothetical protein
MCPYKPSINHLCVFGCVTFVSCAKGNKDKDVKCIFISYCEETKGKKLYNLISQYVIINCDLIFYEFKKIIGETMVSRLDYGLK